jgi:hypothetical protein
VLRGMGSLLGGPPYPVLLMEYEEPLQVGAGFKPMEVLQYLKAKGYERGAVAQCYEPRPRELLSPPHLLTRIPPEYSYLV